MLKICLTTFHISTMIFHTITYIDVIYTFNTFESLHTAKTKKGGEIKFNINFSLNAVFIDCVIASLICYAWFNNNSDSIGLNIWKIWFKIHKGKLQIKTSV